MGIAQAKPAARFIPKGIVVEGFRANILLEKFVNHQPLSREETGFRASYIRTNKRGIVTLMLPIMFSLYFGGRMREEGL